MREFLNAILASIGAEFLTDDEFNSLTIQTAGFDNATYIALDAILATRDSVSDTRLRSKYYFQAHGVSVGPIEGQSNILVGAVL